MPAREPIYHAFVLRFWREDGEDDGWMWRGLIQHVATGEAMPVRDVETLLHFVEQWTGRLPRSDE